MTAGKSIYRWMGEAVLVFASVLGAFLVEDYRHNKQEKEDYINTLLAFRNDVHDQIWMFVSTYDEQLTKDFGVGMPMWTSYHTELLRINDLLSDGVPGNNFEALSEVMAWVPIPEMRFESQFYQPLSAYAPYLLADSLSAVIWSYDVLMKNQAFPGARYNEILNNFKDYAMPRIDLGRPQYGSNREISDSFMFRNSIVMLINEMEQYIIPGDNDLAVELGYLVMEMDVVLAKHRVDTSALPKHWLMLNTEP